MRLLERFDDQQQAKLATDVLLDAGIRGHLRAGREGGFELWIEAEARMNEARVLVADVRARPDDARFGAAQANAAAKRAAEAEEAKAAAARLVAMGRRSGVTGRYGPVSLALVVASIVVAVLTTTPAGLARLELGDRTEIVGLLAFQSYIRDGGYYRWMPGLGDLLGGQLWRLFTPSLLHFGVFHLLFNMWWLVDLGTAIERRHRSLALGLMILGLAAASNAAQYLIGSSPAFGGMSGVVYGLFGYVWLRGRFDPSSGFLVPAQTIYWMMGFFVLCFTGLVGPVANIAHAAGLVLGAAAGFLSSGRWRRLRRG